MVWVWFGLHDFVQIFIIFVCNELLQELRGTREEKHFLYSLYKYVVYFILICFVCAVPEKVANVQVFLFSPLDDASVDKRNAFVIWNNVAGSISGYNVMIFDCRAGMNLSVHSSVQFECRSSLLSMQFVNIYCDLYVITAATD